MTLYISDICYDYAVYHSSGNIIHESLTHEITDLPPMIYGSPFRPSATFFLEKDIECLRIPQGYIIRWLQTKPRPSNSMTIATS